MVARMGIRRSALLVVALISALVAGSCGSGKNPQTTAAAGGSGSTTSAHASIDPDQLPGIQVSAAPWPTELSQLRARLEVINIPALTQEGSAMDLHVHLSVVVDGQAVPVPKAVGVNGEEVNGGKMVNGFVSPLHTHDDSGLVHVHSPTVREFTIGDIFDVWGVRLTATCLGGNCPQADRTLRVFVNGTAVRNPRATPLTKRARIVVTFGTTAQLPSPIPAKFGET